MSDLQSVHLTGHFLLDNLPGIFGISEELSDRGDTFKGLQRSRQLHHRLSTLSARSRIGLLVNGTYGKCRSDLFVPPTRQQFPQLGICVLYLHQHLPEARFNGEELRTEHTPSLGCLDRPRQIPLSNVQSLNILRDALDDSFCLCSLLPYHVDLEHELLGS